jgi:hypothetical protein
MTTRESRLVEAIEAVKAGLRAAGLPGIYEECVAEHGAHAVRSRAGAMGWLGSFAAHANEKARGPGKDAAAMADKAAWARIEAIVRDLAAN